VKIAKDTNTYSLPSALLEAGIEIRNKSFAERFANYFDTKIKKLVVNTSVDDTAYKSN
jgi:hypothetical protein